MTKKTIDADEILGRAKPLLHQHAHEIQPYGHLVKLPIALSEHVCKESVEDVMTVTANNQRPHDAWLANRLHRGAAG